MSVSGVPPREAPAPLDNLQLSGGGRSSVRSPCWTGTGGCWCDPAGLVALKSLSHGVSGRRHACWIISVQRWP